jgi:MarR-like DNA-binding transcriptional regulator SgrR of sgrS sRNA
MANSSTLIVDLIHNWKEITEQEWDLFHNLVR